MDPIDGMICTGVVPTRMLGPRGLNDVSMVIFAVSGYVSIVA
jgi:hypothetical protein